MIENLLVLMMLMILDYNLFIFIKMCYLYVVLMKFFRYMLCKK